MISAVFRQPKGKLELKDNSLFKILQIFNEVSHKVHTTLRTGKSQIVGLLQE